LHSCSPNLSPDKFSNNKIDNIAILQILIVN
jgi:hypothetical protein